MSHTEHHLSATFDAPAHSRQLIARWVSGHPRRHEIILATSEIVANAVIHGAPETAKSGVMLGLDMDRSRMRISVAHKGPAFEWGPRDQHGGLGIVERSVDRWGIEQQDDTVAVWFEVDWRARPSTAANSTYSS